MWYDWWRNLAHQEKLFDFVGPFEWVMYPPQVRVVGKQLDLVPWHQDIGYMKLLGNRAHRQVVTCFVPLEDFPSKCTTWQCAMDNMFNGQEYPHVTMGEFGAGIASKTFRDLKNYSLELGDALIFGDHVLHRTFTPPGCQVERASLEFRLLRPIDALNEKDYYCLKLQSLIHHKYN